MLDAAADLRGAIGVYAAPNRAFISGHDSRAAGDLGSALGALGREAEWNFFADAFGEDNTHNRRDYLSSFFDGDSVADANVFLADVILVMERGAADGAAGEKNGFEFGDRSERTGTANLDGDSLQFGFGLFGGVFVGDSPAGSFGSETHFFALD